MSPKYPRLKYINLIDAEIREQIATGQHPSNLLANSIADTVGVSNETLRNILGMPLHQYVASKGFPVGPMQARRLLRMGRSAPNFEPLLVIGLGLEIAAARSLMAVNRKALADTRGVSRTAAYFYPSNMALRDRVAAEAVARYHGKSGIEFVGDVPESALLPIIGEAVALRLPAVNDLPEALRRDALLSLMRPSRTG